MGIFIGNTTGFKGKKDHANIFKLDIIITSAEEKKDNNPNNSNNNNKDYKKIKVFKSNKYYSKREKLEF